MHSQCKERELDYNQLPHIIGGSFKKCKILHTLFDSLGI